jgi:Sulfotransferase family
VSAPAGIFRHSEVGSRRRAILVTGTHYSGTTWVGRVLARAPNVAYLHEPFNLRAPAGICAAQFPYWYTYLTDDNSDDYKSALADTLAFRYRIRSGIKELDGMSSAARMVRDCVNFAWWRLRGCRPLVKDPIAVLSAEWLQRTFGMDVVMLIRHPAAFALSVKRRNARHPFSHFVEQRHLIEGPLARHAEQLRAFAARESDITDQAGFLWRVLVDAILGFRRRHPDWLFVRYEDLTRDPGAGFRTICEHIDLPFAGNVRRAIEATTTSKNPTDATSARRHSHFRRDITAIVDRWKRELSRDEIDRVRTWTEPMASTFYTDEDWQVG